MEKQRETVFIKNMVCPRCISAVESILSGIGISFSEIRLGEADLLSNITESQRFELESKLIAAGFDLLKSRDDQVCDQVKTFLLQTVNQLDSNPLSQNISDLLTFHFSMSYSRLTQLFSKHENITIEKYFILLKIEKAKEWISYGDLPNKVIAAKLQYSSAAHFSAQFKQVTGLSITEFRQSASKNRHSLDNIQPKAHSH
ncbi:MAG: AraC family transcriptional regulator [Bacteroidetes bacterium]|nr:AraC family transcriptional regulator [Bacteroidota bacterium]